MKKTTLAVLYSIIFFGFSATWLTAEEGSFAHTPPNGFRVSIMAGISTFGMLNAEKNSTTENWNLSYGFTPGLNVYFILGKGLEIGMGFHYQFPQKIIGGSNDKTDYGNSSFIPIYATIRYTFQSVERFDLYAVLRLGYSFFRPDDTFLKHWNFPAGNKNGDGGIYGSFGAGVSMKLLQYSQWGLFLDLVARYDLHLSSVIRNETNLMVVSDAMAVELNLDFVF